ncbi:MAG: metallophosphoesterase [Thermoplasmata archaeon]
MVFPQPLWNERAMIKGSTLVACDLHIGYERELEEKGVFVSSKTPGMVKDIHDMLVEHNVDCLIINGDLKHSIPQASWQEYNEIPNAIDRWLRVVKEVHVVRGNHDGGLENYLPRDVTIHDSRGYRRNDIGYFHGHARPSDEVLDADILVTAHCHPSITLFDKLGKRNKLHCWSRIKFTLNKREGDLIVMPSFNPLLGGVSVNEDGYLGPFFRDIDIIEEDIYLLDGTHLGGFTDKGDPPSV